MTELRAIMTAGVKGARVALDDELRGREMSSKRPSAATRCTYSTVLYNRDRGLSFLQ